MSHHDEERTVAEGFAEPDESWLIIKFLKLKNFPVPKHWGKAVRIQDRRQVDVALSSFVAHYEFD